MIGYLQLDSWAGRGQKKVELIKHTKKSSLVKLLEAGLIPTAGFCEAGTVLIVPKEAIRWEDEKGSI